MVAVIIIPSRWSSHSVGVLGNYQRHCDMYTYLLALSRLSGFMHCEDYIYSVPILFLVNIQSRM